MRTQNINELNTLVRIIQDDLKLLLKFNEDQWEARINDLIHYIDLRRDEMNEPPPLPLETCDFCEAATAVDEGNYCLRCNTFACVPCMTDETNEASQWRAKHSKHEWEKCE